MKTEILLLRHGESLGNERRLFLGHTDMDLSQTGYRQAEAAAEFLKNERIDVIYSSDLIRAYHTAEPNAKIHGLSVIPDKRLREIYAGEWEGVPFAELAEKYPELFSAIYCRRYGSFRGAPGGGESVSALASRLEAAVLDISRQNEGKKILIATHAAAIRALWGKISGMSEKEISEKTDFPANASVSRIEYSDGALIPKSYSESGYLEGLITLWRG